MCQPDESSPGLGENNVDQTPLSHHYPYNGTVRYLFSLYRFIGTKVEKATNDDIAVEAPVIANRTGPGQSSDTGIAQGGKDESSSDSGTGLLQQDDRADGNNSDERGHTRDNDGQGDSSVPALVENREVSEETEDTIVSAADEEEEPPLPDPYADLPGLVASKDPPENGAFVVRPSNEFDEGLEILYLYQLRSRIVSTSFGAVPRDAVFFPSLNGKIWLYAPSPDPDSDLWEIIEFSSLLRMKMFDFDGGELAKLSPCTRIGLWGLYPVDKVDTSSPFALVLRETRRWPKQIVPVLFPYGSTLFMDDTPAKCGVFVRVPSDGAGSSLVEPGIWYFDIGDTTEGRLVINDIDDSALVTCDGCRQGLFVLSPSHDKSRLVHVREHATVLEEMELDVEFSVVRTIVDDGKDGAFVHCRVGDRWKVCHVTKGRSALVNVFDCPKSSEVRSDGEGGVWMWKKVGKKSSRALLHIRRNGKCCEYGELFVAEAEMVR